MNWLWLIRVLNPVSYRAIGTMKNDSPGKGLRLEVDRPSVALTEWPPRTWERVARPFSTSAGVTAAARVHVIRREVVSCG